MDIDNCPLGFLPHNGKCTYYSDIDPWALAQTKAEDKDFDDGVEPDGPDDDTA